MILLDSSVLIDYLRTNDPKLQHLFKTEDGAISGIMRAEILWGARDAAHRQKLIQFLDGLIQVLIPQPLWDLAGDNLAALRRGGITVPFQDAIIATMAIANDIELWARDNQFKLIQGVLPQLRLFQEPP